MVELIEAQYKILNPAAKVPSRKRDTDAAYDIYAVEDAVVPARGSKPISTGLAVAVKRGYYYTIEGRSGLGMKGIVPFRGIIDATYTGCVVVALVNHSNEDYLVQAGDRIAQLIFHKQNDVEFMLVDEFDEEYCQRKEAGFGSSGR